MKKIVYGILILIGGLLITSNFIVDSSKLDHKVVSASGTSCRWISESGYGVGPYYIDTTNNNIANITTTTLTIKDQSAYPTKVFRVLPCNASTGNIEKDGYLIYSEDGSSTFSGYFGFYITSNNSGLRTPAAIYINNGVLSKYGLSGGSTDDTITISQMKNFNYKLSDFITASLLDFRITATENGYTYVPLFEPIAVGYDADINGDGKFTFTCVCAEY